MTKLSLLDLQSNIVYFNPERHCYLLYNNYEIKKHFLESYYAMTCSMVFSSIIFNKWNYKEDYKSLISNEEIKKVYIINPPIFGDYNHVIEKPAYVSGTSINKPDQPVIITNYLYATKVDDNLYHIITYYDIETKQTITAPIKTISLL